MATQMINRPTKIEHGKFRCLIMDAPNNDNLPAYMREMQSFGVTDVVRTCEKTYETDLLVQNGIRAHELVFPDGDPPPEEVIKKWMELVTNMYRNGKGALAVHCVAGLGRAPVLVAIALIEKGVEALDAIMFIREKRRGAINSRQLKFLENYKPRTRGGENCAACVIM